MKIIFITVVLFSKMSNYSLGALLSKYSQINSEVGNLNFTQLVTKYGHTAEQHDVITEDGYILTMFRIPGKRSPVLLTHGLLANGDCWVIRGHGSLGIALADLGYDVWIVNNRGTKFSRRHVYLDPDSATYRRFWDYSFHEMGHYDFAAAIDFVCSETSELVFTVGVSQGAAQQFVLMSLRPEYNERIKLFVALAPAAFFYNMPPSFFTLLADFGPLITGLMETIGVEELFEEHSVLKELIKTFCSEGPLSYAACVEGGIFPILGFNTEGFELDFLPAFFGHAPVGASRKCFVHYDQVYLRKKFSQFDYRIDNLSRYGRLEPPEYDLRKVNAAVALMAGQLDAIVSVENVKIFQKKLPNVIYFEELAAMSHNDFSYGKEASKYMFPSILKLLKKYDYD